MKADAKRVSQQLHSMKHDILGMLVCLGCMHVVWKNCPVTFQDAFIGKKGAPTLA